MPGLVLDNFIWRIGQIIPTIARPSKRFKFVDPIRLDPDLSSGTTRNYCVWWSGSASDIEPTDISYRIAEHGFIVEVVYSTDYKVDDLQKIILSDRNDLNTKLRNPDYYTGHSGDSQADIGLYSRIRKIDRLDRSGNSTWLLYQEWSCIISEDE